MALSSSKGGGGVVEEDLLETFGKVEKAADRAAATGGSKAHAAEAECVDALKALEAIHLTPALLISTQIGKRVRHLMKHHPTPGIRSAASDLFHVWKKLFVNATAQTDINPPNSTRDQKQQQSSSRKRPAHQILAEDYKNAMKKKKVGPNANAVPKCNDPTRDKVREMIAEAFCKVYSEAEGEDLGKAKKADPAAMAVLVEGVMLEKLGRSNGNEKAKYRSILFNLRDKNNPDFRRRVLVGDIEPRQLVTLTSQEMASDARKFENKRLQNKALFDCEIGTNSNATTDQFKCGKCGQRKTTYHQMQTRSADEPMTTFVTCVNCNHHWKFC